MYSKPFLAESVRLLLKYDLIDRLRVNATIVWGQLASSKWVKIIECEVKSGQKSINDNLM